MVGLIVLSVAEGRIVLLPASDILAKVEANQPVEFDNCIIVGDLNLSALKIDEQVHFNDTHFQNLVNFESTHFNSDAYFLGSKFDDTANFGNSSFNSTAYFGYTSFNSSANFRNSNFSSIANFINSKFNDNAYFENSKFNDNAYFENSKFNDNAYFENSNFSGPAHFEVSNFSNIANFASSKFNSDADFAFSKFYGTAYFQSSSFNRTAYFSSSKFKDNAFFYGVTFKNALDLTLTEYDKLYIRWNSNCNLVYDNTAYQLLIENLKKLGFVADADVCYYQFRVGEFLHQNPREAPFMFIINFGAWIFYGYGKKPLYPLLWSIFFIGLFGVFWTTISLPHPNDAINKYSLVKSWPRRVFSLFLIPLILVIWKAVGLKKSKTAIDEYDLVGNWPRNMRDAISFSATVFLSGTKFLVDPPAIPMLPGMSQSLVKRAFLLERLIGAFFSILFFLAISATVVR